MRSNTTCIHAIILLQPGAYEFTFPLLSKLLPLGVLLKEVSVVIDILPLASSITLSSIGLLELPFSVLALAVGT